MFGDLATDLDAGCRRPGLGSFRQGSLYPGVGQMRLRLLYLLLRLFPLVAGHILAHGLLLLADGCELRGRQLACRRELLLCPVEFGLCLFPLLARHIFAGSLQSGTGSLHPFLCGFEPGFRGLGRLPRRQSANLHRVRLRLHDGHAPVVSDGHPALADDSLLPVAAGNGHDMSAGFRTGVDPGLICGHRRTADHPDIRHLPGTAHHDLDRAVLGVDRIIPRTAGGILRRNDHYAVPAFLAVQGFCRSILEYRHRSDPVRRQCIYRRHLEAVDHEKRLAGFSV